MIPLDTTQYTAQYELLRSQIIGSAGDAHLCGVGLGLMLREGMPGWLNAIGAVIHASLARRPTDNPPPSQQPAECSVASVWPSGVQRQDMTALLTSLILSTRRVERSSSREGYRPCQ
ncbi:MAG: hypothetical protein B7Z80_11270 [Rhodospirillales bacterium 20-64-7]|nr:MAG: hypothetical protein B7Z80_11270 [Rhodospirillales bacterium 20-64-7]